MEKSRYSAIKQFEKRERVTFFPLSNVILFILPVLFLAYILFPGKQLVNSLVSLDKLSEVEYRYSMLIMPEFPGLSITHDMLAKDPGEAIKQLKLIPNGMAQNFSSNDVWLSYIVLRTLALKPDLHSNIKSEGKAGMKDYFKYFQKTPDLNSQQLKVLARDGLAIESAESAMLFYDRIAKVYPDQSELFYGEAARAATWAKQCEKSAAMAFTAKDKANSLEDKRYFFFLAIKSFFQCAKYELGMQLAQENLKDLTEDVITYQLLIEYALKAGDPKLANRFLLKLLELQGYSKKQE